MGAFFIYIFKSSVCLAFFYLFFRLLLSRETFHRSNRIALLCVLGLSWLIPCIEVTTSHQIELNQAVSAVEQLLLVAESTSAATVDAGTVAHGDTTISWIHILLLFYLAGIFFFACRNIYSLLSLVRLLLLGKRESLDKGITLVIHDKAISPFSWMKYIVISRKDLEENGREILIHEAAHIRNFHSIDLLIADICIFFQWFNPGAWLLKRELQNIHEYEADRTVIKEGVNAKEYQLLLIKKAVDPRLYTMANSFNQSKLKKRITMMLKEKSSSWARMKYFYMLPLAAVAVVAFARPEISKTIDEIYAVSVNDLTKITEINSSEKEDIEVLADTTKKTMVVEEPIRVEHSTAKVVEAGQEQVNVAVLSEEEHLIVADNNIPFVHSDVEVKDEHIQLVSGVVRDDEGNPISEALVLVKGTDFGTVTDSGGNFQLRAPKNGILFIRAEGMHIIETKVVPTVRVFLIKE